MSGPIRYFDDDKAKAVCEAYLASCKAPVHQAEFQADVDGFWRVLRSEAAMEHLVLRTLEHQPPVVMAPKEGLMFQSPPCRHHAIPSTLDCVAVAGGKASVEVAPVVHKSLTPPIRLPRNVAADEPFEGCNEEPR